MEKPVFVDSRKKKRPDLLVLILILTFLGSGLQFFSNLFYSFYKDYFIQNLDKSIFDLEGLKEILEMPLIYFQLNALFYASSIVGAILMWNLRKKGFHIYALSKIALLFILTIYNPFDTTPLFAILTTSLFIFLYFRHLKYMS